MTRTKASITMKTTKPPRKTRGGPKMKTKAPPPSRTIVPERGIATNSEKHGPIEGWLTDDIAQLGWEVFVEPPEKAITEFVLEFLNAVNKGEFPKVAIGGVDVHFTPTEFNETYNLTNVPSEQDEFDRYLAGRFDAAIAEEVLKGITFDDAQWKKGECLPRAKLRYEAKVWMHFINSRIIPASHDSRVNWDRAVLVYCILTKKKFDVGRIVCRNLEVNAKRKTPFYFPCLVTAFSKLAGAKTRDPDIEERIPLSSDIDQSTLKRIRNNQDEEDGSEEEEEEESVKGQEQETEQKEEESESTREATPIKKGKAPMKAISTRKPVVGSSSSMGQNTIGAGFDLMDMRIRNIEKMLAEELQDLKLVAVSTKAERDAFGEIIQEYQGVGQPTKKRKKENEEERETTLENLLKGLANDVAQLREMLVKKGEGKTVSEEIRQLKKEMTEAKHTEQAFRRYIKERDAIMNRNWAEKFKNQPPFPAFPDILSPEELANAPASGATEEQKEQ